MSLMEETPFPALGPIAKMAAPLIAALVICRAGIGYAVHEHHSAETLATQKQTLTAQNEQMTAQLALTRTQLDALAAKVNAMTASNAPAGNEASRSDGKPSPETPATRAARSRRQAAGHRLREDPRFNKLQSEVDAQGKEIEATRGDLASARTELSGSIARTHGELVVLEKKGERNYVEFDLQKSKEFKREGPVGISLRKANTKHAYADLMLMVDDRNLTDKHVNLYQPAMFYEPDSPQPIEVVINDISKDHIHGYVSAPKYRLSELNAMQNGGDSSAAGAGQAANSGQGDNGIVGGTAANGADQATNAQPTLRKRLPLPSGGQEQQ
ncbi:MAG: hypothetical protein WBC92_02845 [Terracidiphilus sp.]